jgi:hypothetical protein
MRCTKPLVVCALLACTGGGPTGPAHDDGPVDTTEPVALDLAAVRAGAPDTYKGLPLALVDNGTPTVSAVDGVIGVVCVGMSNGNQECADFQDRLAGPYAEAVHPAVRVVNCAVGGHAVEKWIDPSFDDVLWERCIAQRLPQAGVRLDQVRVIWHKVANQFTTLAGGGAKPLFPDPGSDYAALLTNLDAFAFRVRSFFPGVQAIYSSSRSYGGYAADAARRGEPLSYEEGHALNSWLAAHGSVDGVWYGWGPYLWAPPCSSGQVNGSGICYDRADYRDDGVHPAEGGRAKVSDLLHQRFLEEAWYRR